MIDRKSAQVLLEEPVPEEAKSPTRVFISYSWDSEEHKNRVLQLANTLRKPWGIETDIDQYVRAKPPYTPTPSWDIWMEKRIEWAEFVLIVCTKIYKGRFRGDEEPGVGRGVTWEGTIIRQNLYNDKLADTKFIPVVFSSQDLEHVPLILNGRDKYTLTDEASFRMLGYRLRREPLVEMPDVEAKELSSPPKPVFFSTGKASIEPPPVVTQIETLNNVEKSIEKEAERVQVEQPSPDALKGNYARLEALLKTGEWREADQETAKQMCQVMGRQKEGWLRVEDVKQFPCADLRAIDQLWVKHSNGKFGFSVQKKIWQQCGSPTKYNKQWEKFGERVGWRTKGVLGMGAEWKDYPEVTFDTSAPEGHLPFLDVKGFNVLFPKEVFPYRVKMCKL